MLPWRRPDPRHNRPLLPGNSFPLHLAHRSSHQLGWVRVSRGVFTAHMQTAELGSSLLQGLLSACSRSTDPSLAADLALSACQTHCPLLLTSALVGPAARTAAGLLCPSLKPPLSYCASGAVGVKRTCLNAGGVTGPPACVPMPVSAAQRRVSVETSRLHRCVDVWAATRSGSAAAEVDTVPVLSQGYNCARLSAILTTVSGLENREAVPAP